ncbi:hypothetical protein [Streptomyces sp. NPDC059071]|uniref:DUF7187 family protein n=1 Tax=unclassified Streptomyces TaxID=2593676 RepID=UPI0036486540
MSEPDDFEVPEDLGELLGGEIAIDFYSSVRRAASIVGDLRKALREEGFTREDTFELVQAYWVSEMGVI